MVFLVHQFDRGVFALLSDSLVSFQNSSHSDPSLRIKLDSGGGEGGEKRMIRLTAYLISFRRLTTSRLRAAVEAKAQAGNASGPAL